MSENEALKLVESMQISKDCELIKTLDLKGTLIKSLEDLQQYRAIGTVEEFKVLKEKSTAKSRILRVGKYYCPACGRKADMGYCKTCGQNLY